MRSGAGAVRFINTIFGARAHSAGRRQKLANARLTQAVRVFSRLPALTLGTVLFALSAWTTADADDDRLPSTGSVIAQARKPTEPSPATEAAACARTMEQFIPQLDAVMTANARSLDAYFAVLAKYLHLKNGVRGLPAPAPDTSITGCNIEQVAEIAKRSRFFLQATAVSPQYLYFVVEFRSSAVISGFAIEKATGNIKLPYAKWTTVYP